MQQTQMECQVRVLNLLFVFAFDIAAAAFVAVMLPS